MRGWTPDGDEVELAPWQEQVVRWFMENSKDGTRGTVFLPVRARMAGKSTVTATIRRITANRERTGEWFPDEP